jgi:crotonobetainyl-CoA:carnitine CoA-transferase CaiB-like acyl-CoA transferase
MLSGTRVVEVGDEMGEYCGLLLAGLGADVVRIEPPGGSPTRRIGPFLGDRPDPEGSLYFWHYNRAKRSVALDVAAADGRPALKRLLAGADVLLDSTCGGLNAAPPGALAREVRRSSWRASRRSATRAVEGLQGSDLVHPRSAA